VKIGESLALKELILSKPTLLHSWYAYISYPDFKGSLIGANFPSNSIGRLETDLLDNTKEYKSAVLFKNAEQIYRQFERKEQLREEYEPFFKKYEYSESMNASLKIIQNLIDTGEFIKADIASKTLIRKAHRGLRYYHTYDWFLLRTIVTFGYLGWIGFILCQSIPKTQNFNSSNVYVLVAFSTLSLVSFAYLFMKKSPWRYYAYLAFPLMFWFKVALERKHCYSLIRVIGVTYILESACALLLTSLVIVSIYVFYFRRLHFTTGCL
jgi:phosphatidylinositol glycan class N